MTDSVNPVETDALVDATEIASNPASNPDFEDVVLDTLVDSEDGLITEEETPKKKLNKGMIISIASALVCVLLIIAAIYFQSNPPGPKPEGFYMYKSEEYASKIVVAHNELFSVDPERDMPDGNIGGVVRAVASGELNKRIKTMRTNANKLLDLEAEEGFEIPDEMILFAQFILDEEIPFWESVEERLQDVRTSGDALALWDELRDDVENGEYGQSMHAAYQGLANVGNYYGWEESSYKARIR
jgi:hypothetical protein